jgi:type IV pilus assembly protein PilW
MKPERTYMRRAAERGFSLTEVMVAITLSVFLLMGLFTILQQTRNANSTTTGLSQLQDDERVAMTIMTDTIEAAGYVPEANGSGQSLLVADAVFATQGQIIVAGTGGASVGERLTMRYVLGLNDTTLKCDGTTNGGAEQVYKEIFQITTNAAGVNQLVCIPSNGATAVPLVNNVANLTFQFAVNRTSTTSTTASNVVGPNTASSSTGYGCPADTWMTTANMQTNDWTNVCAVKVDIVFVNPIYQPAGQARATPGQKQYITFERVIAIQSKTGVNLTNSTQT